MATRQGSKIPSKAKKLTITELRSIAKALQKEDSGSRLSNDVLDIIRSLSSWPFFLKDSAFTTYSLPHLSKLLTGWCLLCWWITPKYLRLARRNPNTWISNWPGWIMYGGRVGEQGYVLGTSPEQ